MAFLEGAICANASDTTPSNAGVAGAGVLLSFMITAVIALILSVSVMLGDFQNHESAIRRKLLNGYSDSQILQGIGIQCVGLAKMNTLVPYHFFLIWMQSLLSMATHNATILALIHDYRHDWVLRWIRQFLMFVNLVLSSVSGILVLRAVSSSGDDKTLPIACALRKTQGRPASSVALSYAGTIFVIAGNCIIFALATWFLHNRRQRLRQVVQVIGLLLMSTIAIGAGARICLLSQAFGTPPVTLSDEGEKSWSFGQVLSVLVLAFPLLSAVEIYRGEISVASRRRPSDGVTGPNSHASSAFQPSPLSRMAFGKVIETHSRNSHSNGHGRDFQLQS